jgi:hypothetical protein
MAVLHGPDGLNGKDRDLPLSPAPGDPARIPALAQGKALSARRATEAGGLIRPSRGSQITLECGFGAGTILELVTLKLSARIRRAASSPVAPSPRTCLHICR